MSAKDMFEELGFKQVGNNDTLIEYLIDYDNQKFIKKVVFNKFGKFYWVDSFENKFNIYGDIIKKHSILPIDIQLSKAINQQIKELMWYE